MTLRWSDPFMSPEYGDPPTPAALEKAISLRGKGPSPYLPAVKNVVFLNAMAMIWLGAKNIVFTGIDPLQPDYFFANNLSISLDLVRAITKSNPWIAEWDGRNERIPIRQRESQHRRVKVISNLLAPEGSGVRSPDRLKTMHNGFKLLLDYCRFKEVNVSYIGKSQFFQLKYVCRRQNYKSTDVKAASRAAAQIAANASAHKLAPPTSAPLTKGIEKSDEALSAFTEPPYKIGGT